MNGSFLITDTTSNVLYASHNCSGRAGFDIPEIIGKKPGELWGGLMPKSYYERFWSKIVRGEPYVGRVENKRKDGTRYIDEMHVAPILNDADTLQYYIEFHPDLASKQERIDFKKEFIFAGVTSAEPMRLAHLLSRWMDQDVTLGVLSRDSLIRFLEQAYIAETQHALKARKNDLELIHEAQRQAEKFSEIYIKYVFQVRAFFSHRVNVGCTEFP